METGKMKMKALVAPFLFIISIFTTLSTSLEATTEDEDSDMYYDYDNGYDLDYYGNSSDYVDNADDNDYDFEDYWFPEESEPQCHPIEEYEVLGKCFKCQGICDTDALRHESACSDLCWQYFCQRSIFRNMTSDLYTSECLNVTSDTTTPVTQWTVVKTPPQTVTQSLQQITMTVQNWTDADNKTFVTGEVSGDNKMNKKLIISLSTVGGLILVVAVVGICCLWKRCGKSRNRHTQADPEAAGIPLQDRHQHNTPQGSPEAKLMLSNGASPSDEEGDV